MNRKSAVKLATVIMMAALVLFFGVLILSDALQTRQGTGIVLPEPETTAASEDPQKRAEVTSSAYEEVRITPRNVLEVLSTLQRPENYVLYAQTEVLYGSRTLHMDVVHAVRGQDSATVRTGEGRMEHTVRRDGVTYTWSDGSDLRSWQEGGDFGGDAAAGLPSYEEAIATEGVRVTDADYRQYEGFSCVFFTVIDAGVGLTSDYYVDIDTGLLVRSETRDGIGNTIYTMRIQRIERMTPQDSAFDLPGP